MVWKMPSSIYSLINEEKLLLENFKEGQGRRRKNFQGGGTTEKRSKNSKKIPKNCTFKLLSTIFVPCVKILGAMAPRIADAHAQGRSQGEAARVLPTSSRNLDSHCYELK